MDWKARRTYLCTSLGRLRMSSGSVHAWRWEVYSPCLLASLRGGGGGLGRGGSVGPAPPQVGLTFLEAPKALKKILCLD